VSADALEPMIYGATQRAEWPLDPAVTYLNHGGYGVAPLAVLAAQAEWRARIERNPTRFMSQELPAAQRAAAATLAAHLGAEAEDLVFVDNATAGINAVLRSLDFRPGDQILLTDLAYGAVRKAVRYAAARSGATVVEVEIALPVPDLCAIHDAIARRLGPRTKIARTKLAIFDHVASHSALVLPVAELSALARACGAHVLIDGAHAPGQMPLDLPASGADWYVGNCHKWLMAPRGCGFLWARSEAQALIHPLAISHGFGAGFIAEFDWTGTRDPSPFLCVPAGIAHHRQLGGAKLMARNAALARQMAQMLAEAWGTVTSGPVESFAAMATLRVPGTAGATAAQALALQRSLSDDHRVEIAVFAHGDHLWLRLAAQAYNELADGERLIPLLP
jgi:isopenicillin-N epimerase